MVKSVWKEKKHFESIKYDSQYELALGLQYKMMKGKKGLLTN